MSLKSRMERRSREADEWLTLLELAKAVVRTRKPDDTALTKLRIQVTLIERERERERETK